MKDNTEIESADEDSSISISHSWKKFKWKNNVIFSTTFTLLLFPSAIYGGLACLSNPCINGICMDDVNRFFHSLFRRVTSCFNFCPLCKCAFAFSARTPAIASTDTREYNAKLIGTNAGRRRAKMAGLASTGLPNIIARVPTDTWVNKTHTLCI